MIQFEIAKKRIAILWFVLSAFLFSILFLQTMLGKFENKNQEAWEWFVSNVIPTLSLMISVFLVDINKKNTQSIQKFYYYLTFITSIFFLSILLFIILSQPFMNKPIIELMNESKLYLSPFQVLVSASLGLFFMK